MQLAGVRIEATEIGLLMQDVFATERRALHARIEQAVGHNGMNKAAVDALPIFQVPEKVPTTIADLSSLIEVSLEEDEQKLQKSYAHSKVTLVRPNGKRETVMTTPTVGYKSRSPLIAFLSLSALAGVSLAVLSHREDPKPALDTKGSFATSATQSNNATTVTSTNAPKPAASAPIAAPLLKADRPIRSDRIIRPGQHDLADRLQDRNDAPKPVALPAAREAAATRPTQEPSRRNTDSGRHDEPARSRATASARASADNSPREAPSRGKAAANSSAVDEGTDLTFGRRVPFVRIDSENPYQ
jgi:hypothetical protein